MIELYPQFEHALTNFLNPLVLSKIGDTVWCVFRNKNQYFHLMKYHFLETQRVVFNYEHHHKISSIKVIDYLKKVISGDSAGNLIVFDMSSEKVVQKVDFEIDIEKMILIGPLIVSIFCKTLSIYDMINKTFIWNRVNVFDKYFELINWCVDFSNDFGKNILVFLSLCFSKNYLFVLNLKKEIIEKDYFRKILGNLVEKKKIGKIKYQK